MNNNRLGRSFYQQDTHRVARGLLGKLLVRKWRDKYLVARICEVESYVGENDRACHASKGFTERTAVMFGEAGLAYVYLIYGMYHCLNVVTEREGFPAAVLIRSAIPVENICSDINGPGKLTREMKITRVLNNEDIVSSKKLFIADDGYKVSKKNIVSTERVGVAYAGQDAKLPWRYYIKDCVFISGKQKLTD